MIKYFKTPDELFAYAEGVRRSFEALPIQEWQQQMKPGDHFVQVAGECYCKIPCDIYGTVVESDYPEDKALMAANPQLRLCLCYSPLCVEGELGNIYIATMDHKLTDEQFVKAKERGWPAWKSL